MPMVMLLPRQLNLLVALHDNLSVIDKKASNTLLAFLPIEFTQA